MLEAVSRREFEVLLFWSLDRFSREGMVETLNALKRISDYGIKYRSLQESYIDTTNPFGDLLTALSLRSQHSNANGSESGSTPVWNARRQTARCWADRRRR